MVCGEEMGKKDGFRDFGGENRKLSHIYVDTCLLKGVSCRRFGYIG